MNKRVRSSIGAAGVLSVLVNQVQCLSSKKKMSCKKICKNQKDFLEVFFFLYFFVHFPSIFSN